MLGQTIISTSIFNIVFLVFPIMFFSMFGYAIYAAVKNNRKYQNGFHTVLTKKILLDTFNEKITYFILAFFTIVIAGVCACMITVFKGATNVKGNNVNTYIVISVPAFILFIFGIVIIIILKNSFVTKNAIRDNNFIIYVDVLGDKDQHTSSDSDGTSTTTYYFYFQYLFKNFRKKITVSGEEYRNANVGDEFYVVFMKPTKKIKVFKKSTYDLDYDIRSTLVDNPNLDEFYKKKVSDKNYTSDSYNIPIDERALYEKFKKSRHTNALIGLFIGLAVLIPFLVMAVILKSIMGVLCSLIFIVVICIVLYSNIKLNITAKNMIYSGQYRILSKIITEDVSDMHLKDSDRFLFFKVEGLPYEIKCPVDDFGRLNIGDEVYLFYLNTNSINNTATPFAVINPNKYHLAHNIMNKLNIL